MSSIAPKTIDLGNLQNELSFAIARRDAIKDAYDAIHVEAAEKGHDVAHAEGDPQGMGLRISNYVAGFGTAQQAVAVARVVGYNATLDRLALSYAVAVAETRAITAEITALGG